MDATKTVGQPEGKRSVLVDAVCWTGGTCGTVGEESVEIGGEFWAVEIFRFCLERGRVRKDTTIGTAVFMDLSKQAQTRQKVGGSESSRICELEKFLHEKDVQIHELEKLLHEKDLRIALLEQDFLGETGDLEQELAYGHPITQALLQNNEMRELVGTFPNICSWFHIIMTIWMNMELQMLLSLLQKEKLIYAPWSGPLHQRLAGCLEMLTFSTKEWDLSLLSQEGDSLSNEQGNLLNHIKALNRHRWTGSWENL